MFVDATWLNIVFDECLHRNRISKTLLSFTDTVIALTMNWNSIVSKRQEHRVLCGDAAWLNMMFDECSYRNRTPKTILSLTG
jgi:hypothetical protein